MAISSVTFFDGRPAAAADDYFCEWLPAPQSMRLLAAAYKRCEFDGHRRAGPVPAATAASPGFMMPLKWQSRGGVTTARATERGGNE
jgi:hypothetical protein